MPKPGFRNLFEWANGSAHAGKLQHMDYVPGHLKMLVMKSKHDSLCEKKAQLHMLEQILNGGSQQVGPFHTGLWGPSTTKAPALIMRYRLTLGATLDLTP
jgi:hypothetical protein